MRPFGQRSIFADVSLIKLKGSFFLGAQSLRFVGENPEGIPHLNFQVGGLDFRGDLKGLLWSMLMTRSRTPTLKVGSCKTQVNVLSRAFDGGMEERK